MARKKSAKSSVEGPRGFRAGGISAGIKTNGRKDLGMIVASGPIVVTAVFTKNRFRAAPVELCASRLKGMVRQMRGVVVNSGNANAMTGKTGAANAVRMATVAEQATESLEESFLVASTGIIGKQMPMDKLEAGIRQLAPQVSYEGWEDFAEAILTTDTCTKIRRRTFVVNNKEGPEEHTILGIAKGSGMIQPNMATMLGFLLTDFPLEHGKVRDMLREITDETFNCVTVDGQTSTNDTVFLMGSRIAPWGRSARPIFKHDLFEGELRGVCRDLAMDIARDGEGISRLITVSVKGTNRAIQARRMGMEIANSPLVKTAVFGADPNWGRIIQALGKSRVPFKLNEVAVSIQGQTVVERGLPVDFPRESLAKAMKAKEVDIGIVVGAGPASSTVWTCDLTPDYIKINADYN